MRVLIVNKHSTVTGGVDRHCFALADHLRDAGHEVAMLATRSEEPPPVSGELVARRVTRADRDRLPARERAGVAAAALWNRESAVAMQKLIDDFDPTVVHAHKLYPQLSIAPVVVAARARVPVVQTLHDYGFLGADELSSAGGWSDRRSERLSYRGLNMATYLLRRTVHRRCVSAWISVSEFVRDRHRAIGIDSTVIPNFRLADPKPDPPGFNQRRGIAFAGRLSEEKGVTEMIALAARLSVPVSIAGDGPLAPTVRRAAEEHENLSFLGQIEGEAVSDLLLRSRVCALPSRWDEPGALTLVEAMACGTPICTYAVGGTPEYVPDAAGEIVRPGDFAALAEACDRLHGEELRWHQTSQAGLETVRERFAPGDYVERFEELVRGLDRR